MFKKSTKFDFEMQKVIIFGRSLFAKLNYYSKISLDVVNFLVIQSSLDGLRTHETVHNLNHKDANRQSHSGRPKSSRTPHNVPAFINFVSSSPSKSVRSQFLGIN